MIDFIIVINLFLNDLLECMEGHKLLFFAELRTSHRKTEKTLQYDSLNHRKQIQGLGFHLLVAQDYPR